MHVLYFAFSVLYGVLFTSNKDAAFANFRMLNAIGMFVPFGYSGFICTSTKLYILLICLILGMVGYIIVDCRKPKEDRLIVDDDIENS